MSRQGKSSSALNAVQSNESPGALSQRRGWYKRPLDLTIWFVAHLLLFPLWLLLWVLIPLAILLDDGPPVFYRLRKVGKDGKTFETLKFRTMVRNADSTGPPWTAQNDPRITRFGRLLRKTALDELPQVLSILKGDMSFVGPRAYSPGAHQLAEQEVPGFARRLQVRPGLTGFAQVYGDPQDPLQRLSCDLHYIEHRTLWLDIKLFLLSVWIALRFDWERKRM